jgi:predicted TIM-barrel fold metal-dependent hydrolase
MGRKTSKLGEAIHHYLEGLVDAGFGERIVFASDEMVWPHTIARAIRTIEGTPVPDSQQKRDMLDDSAARFFRLSDAIVAKQSGMWPSS